MFVITSMPVGGAETLLVNLIRRLDRSHFLPELCCLKELGPLGEVLAREIPAFDHLLTHKTDLRVLPRLAGLLRRRRVDAVVTVGAGDKMFWGRLAARWARVPVVCSALHSTGWPDTVGRLNRLLTPITDAFIAVAAAHGKFLVDQLHFPAAKVHVIPNGIDVERFRQGGDRLATRAGAGPDADNADRRHRGGAAAGEESRACCCRPPRRSASAVPEAVFLIVGDGPERPRLEALAEQLGVAPAVRFLGTRSDIPQLLSALDVFVLTSRIEANPVSILEAMAAGLPVVAPNVGSISESVDRRRDRLFDGAESCRAGGQATDRAAGESHSGPIVGRRRPAGRREDRFARQHGCRLSATDQRDLHAEVRPPASRLRPLECPLDRRGCRLRRRHLSGSANAVPGWPSVHVETRRRTAPSSPFIDARSALHDKWLATGGVRHSHTGMDWREAVEHERVATTMNEITPYPVFVGHAADGRAVKELLDQGIRAIVQLAAEEPPIVTPRDLVFCRFPLEDGSGNDADLLSLAITSVAHLVSRGVPTLVCCGARDESCSGGGGGRAEHRRAPRPGRRAEVRHAVASGGRGAGILERRLPRGRDASEPTKRECARLTGRLQLRQSKSLSSHQAMRGFCRNLPRA